MEVVKIIEPVRSMMKRSMRSADWPRVQYINNEINLHLTLLQLAPLARSPRLIDLLIRSTSGR